MICHLLFPQNITETKLFHNQTEKKKTLKYQSIFIVHFMFCKGTRETIAFPVYQNHRVRASPGRTKNSQAGHLETLFATCTWV